MDTAATDLDVDKLLAAAAALGRDPGRGQLEALAVSLRDAASGVDIAALRSAVSLDEPRLILGRHADGPVLAVRWYRPGEVSTVHTHAWTVLAQLDGESAFERWSATPDGTAELTESTGPGAGGIVTIGEGEPHRQRGLGESGALELALLGHYDEARPREDLEPGPATESSSALIDAFLDGYRRADVSALAPLFAPDVILDANVPDWRFQLQGRDALVSLLADDEFAPEYRLTGWRATPTVVGAAVEIECEFLAEGETRRSREMHVLRGGEGGVVRHTLYCTGIWHADVIERQAREAPMVDR